MPRRLRFDSAGYVFHVLNRAVARTNLFEKGADYAAFVEILRQAEAWRPMRLLAYCLMPNHWHLVLWPRNDGDLSAYLRWLTVTHVQRWHAHHHTSGSGSLYQGRYKSFPVQEDEHLLTVCRYVERNALRAGLVTRAEAWQWGSLRQRLEGSEGPVLHSWPVAMPRRWTDYVNQAETEAELAALRSSVTRGGPFGDEAWQKSAAQGLGLQSALRPRGRPRKKIEPE
jgi:putative transposase